MSRTYTGVGARTTPAGIRRLMTRLAHYLGTQGYTLRTGDAKGADAAFVAGARLAGKIKPSVFSATDASPKALALAAMFHPAWEKCSSFAKKLHARNGFQVLGLSLSEPTDFVVCWTPGGKGGGGTGQAIRLARGSCSSCGHSDPKHDEATCPKCGASWGIRVYDLGDPKVEASFRRRLDEVATT